MAQEGRTACPSARTPSRFVAVMWSGWQRITAVALFLVVAVGATAHHVYETHLSSSYAPILQAAMISSYRLTLSNINKR